MAKKTLPRETKSYVAVTLKRTVTQFMTVGVLVDNVDDAPEAVLKMPKVQRDAGWVIGEVSEPEVSSTDHQLGVFNPNTGYLEVAR